MAKKYTMGNPLFIVKFIINFQLKILGLDMRKTTLSAAICSILTVSSFSSFANILDIDVTSNKSNIHIKPYFSSSSERYKLRVVYKNLSTSETKKTAWFNAEDISFKAASGINYQVTLEAKSLSSGNVFSITEDQVSLGHLFQHKMKRTNVIARTTAQNAADWNTNFILDSDAFPRLNITADLIYQTKSFDGSNGNYRLLTSNDISIVEDDRYEEISRFVQPDPNSSKKIVDIVFVHDDSGSLGDEAAQVKANIISFVQGLSDQNFDFRIGLVPYGGGGRSSSFSDPDGRLLNNGSLTSDPLIFQSYIDQMRFDGGTEKAFDAVKLAVDGTLWRPSTQKVVILITDENNDRGQVDEATVTQSLVNNNILFYGLTSGHNEYNRMAQAVSGQVFNIRSDFSTILTEIGADLSSRYEVQYISDNSIIDGSERTIDLSVGLTDENATSIIGQFQLTYTPTLPVTIELGSNTLSLTKQGQLPEKSLPIRVLTGSQVPLIGLQLGYKHSSSTGFTLVDMVVQNDGSWLANVPEETVLEGAVHFYISAVTDKGIKTLPSADPQVNPFVVTIFPNVPPEFSHTPVEYSAADQAIAIEAIAEDATNQVENIQLYYREVGAPIFTKVESYQGTSYVNYQATIPAESVTQSGVEYYLVAIDDFGSETYLGSADSPFIINVENNGMPDACNNYSNVTVCADQFQSLTSGSSIITASGNVQLKTLSGDAVLGFSGSVQIDETSSVVSTIAPGRLTALNIALSDSLTKDFDLSNMAFTLDAKVVPLKVTPTLSFNYTINSMFFNGSTIELNDTDITIPTNIVIPFYSDFANAAAKVYSPIQLGDLVLSPDSRLSSQNITVDLTSSGLADKYLKKGFGNSGLSVELKEFSIDVLKPGVGFGAAAAWNKTELGLKMGININPIELDSFEVSYSGAKSNNFLTASKIPIGASGLVFVHNKTSLGWQQKDFTLSGSLSGYFSDVGGIMAELGSDRFLKKSILSGELGLKISNSGQTWAGYGQLKILETFKLASTQLTAGLLPSGQLGMQLEGDLNVANILLGRVLFNAESGANYTQLLGQSALTLQVPNSIFLFGGTRLLGQQAEILLKSCKTSCAQPFTAYVQTIAQIGSIDIGIRVDFSDPTDIDFDIVGTKEIISTAKKTKGANAVSANQVEYQVNLSGLQDSAIFAITADVGLADIELITPTGEVLKPADYRTSLGDANNVNMPIFYIDNGNNEAYFGLTSPADGDYKLVISNNDSLTNATANIVLPVPTPDVQITAKTSQLSVGESFDVDIDLTNATSTAEVKFSLQQVGSNFTMPLDIFELSNGQYVKSLTLPATLSSGDYQLVAHLTASGSASTTTVQADTITVENPVTPLKPTQLAALFDNASAVISWAENSDPNISQYVLHIANVSKATEQSIVIAKDQLSYKLSTLTNGDSYTFKLASISDSGLLSAYSDEVFGSPTGSFVSGSPDLSFVNDGYSVTSVSGTRGEPITFTASIKNVGLFDAYSARVNCYFDEISASHLVKSTLLGNISKDNTLEVSCDIDQSTYNSIGNNVYFTITDTTLAEANVSNNILVAKNPYIKNVAPQGDADVASVNEDESVSIDVLANDSDLNGDVISIESFTQPGNGTVALVDGKLLYTPIADYNGSDSFSYSVTDSELTTSNVVVSMDVIAVNDAPSANAGAPQTVSEGDSVTFGATISDIDSTDLTFEWTQLSGDTIEFSDKNSLSPTLAVPYVSAKQVVSFQLSVSDGELSTASVVELTILNDNNAPEVSISNVTSKNEGDEVTINATVSDADNDELTLNWKQTAGTQASLSVTNTNSLSFTVPQVQKNETLTFELSAADAEHSTVKSVSFAVNNKVEPKKESKSSGGGVGAVLLAFFALFGRKRLNK